MSALSSIAPMNKRRSFASNALIGQIPSEIGRLTSLTSLCVVVLTCCELTIGLLWHRVLFSNQLAGQIPTEIGQLIALKSLYVIVLASSVSDVSSLHRSLLPYASNLNTNKLSGQIPLTIGQFATLSYLYVVVAGCAVSSLTLRDKGISP
jgi:hypothetical protein